MYFKVEEGVLKLPTAALSKLEANKDNVLSLIEYKAKKDLAVTASYANNAITFKCGNETKSITVKDVSNDSVQSTSFVVTPDTDKSCRRSRLFAFRGRRSHRH